MQIIYKNFFDLRNQGPRKGVVRLTFLRTFCLLERLHSLLIACLNGVAARVFSEARPSRGEFRVGRREWPGHETRPPGRE